MPSQKSGGARAVEKKHRERAARRPKGYDEAALAEFRAAHRQGKSAADALDEAMAFLRVAMRQAGADPGLPAEQRREQINRIASSLTKAADPKKLVEELGAELREANALIDELREKVHAAQVAARDPSGSSTEAPH